MAIFERSFAFSDSGMFAPSISALAASMAAWASVTVSSPDVFVTILTASMAAATWVPSMFLTT